VVAAAAYMHQRRQAETSRVAVRTVQSSAVGFGDVEATVRVSGTVAAENFAGLLAPQIRGSRSGRGRGGSSNSRLTSVSAAGEVSYSYSTSSSSSSSDSGGGDSGSSRGSGSPRGSSRDSGMRASSSLRISTGGGDDRGSTSGGGMSGGGSSGSSHDFMLVLLQLAKPGSTVKKGDVVAEFDRQYQVLRRDDYRSAVVQMEANIKSMQAKLETNRKSLEVQVQAAKATLDKALLDLKTAEVRSAIEMERFRLAVEEARANHGQLEAQTRLLEVSQAAQIKATEIDISQARIELRRAEINADRMLVRAPMDGIVVMQSLFRGGDFGQIKEGDQVAAGQSFMSIVDPTSMVLNATINQVDSERLRLGMKARARVDAYPDLETPATVIGIGALAKPSTFRASFVGGIPVRLKLERTEPRIIPDLSASAEIVLGAERQTAVLPRGAVFQDGDRGSFVFLRRPDGWLRRPVETGMASHVVVAVRSGVQKGDVVALDRPQ
jgi:multidrug resistance efflux pump